MKVLKGSGVLAEFSKEKLKHSLLKSGASLSVVESILEEINKQMYDGISTRKIYKLASTLLKKVSASHAARYNLRSAIQMLGPDGFFFEKFMARLFANEGFETINNLILNGKCVSHEIDIAVRKNNHIYMIECKFHGSSTGHSDVKVPMYILSRFNDLKNNTHRIFEKNNKISHCYITTNNRFTTDAITFANCSGLELLGWDYPAQMNLKTKIDNSGLYPITCLTTLSAIEKEKLLILDIIMVKELIANPNKILQIAISENRQKNIIKEALALCNTI